MSISKITPDQLSKIWKAIQYSFLAGFTGSFVLQATDLVDAIHNGHAALVRLGVSVVTGALVGGINGVAFAVEQLFTQSEFQQKQ